MVMGCHDEQSIYSFAAPLALVWGGILRMRRSAIFQKFRCVCGMIVILLVRPARYPKNEYPKLRWFFRTPLSELCMTSHAFRQCFVLTSTRLALVANGIQPSIRFKPFLLGRGGPCELRTHLWPRRYLSSLRVP